MAYQVYILRNVVTGETKATFGKGLEKFSSQWEQVPDHKDAINCQTHTAAWSYACNCNRQYKKALAKVKEAVT